MILDHLNGQTTNAKVVFKSKTRTAIIKWTLESSLLSNALHLYKGTSQEGLQRIVHFDAEAKEGKTNSQKYSGSVSGRLVTLTISKLELKDDGTYFYAHWDANNSTVITVRGNHNKNLQ